MKKGRLTLPTDVGMIEETIKLKQRLQADALRDCDGTIFPDELKNIDAKIYATYYTTRKDNKWPSEHPKEIQQEYLITPKTLALTKTLKIDLLKDFNKQQFKINKDDDPKKYWEVIDRTNGEIVENWKFLKEEDAVLIDAKPFHEYTVAFLVYLIWDPVHMYNFITNDWESDHQITYDVRNPLTKEYVKNKLHKYCQENPHIDVVRFTTFFHQFTLVFDDKNREKYVEWFGYNASVSPYIIDSFEKWAGYKFRPEYIVDQGYHNVCFRNPSKQFKDFMTFQQMEVSELAKELVDIVHSYGKEAMMFLGDHWIGTEPYGEYFKNIGLDAVVGSVGNGTTLRMLSDIEGVKYHEGRLLPYFFPDVFNENGNPIKEARVNWLQVRRAFLRSPLERIGYGGYLKLALEAKGFVEEIEKIVEEFRTLFELVEKEKAKTAPFKIAILSSWGKIRTWMCNQVHHAIDYREVKSYFGILECLSGMAFDIKFIDFEDLINGLDKDIKVIINAGKAYTSWSGGENFIREDVLVAIRKFVYEGGGFIGLGDPSAYSANGHFFQLSDVLGVEKEMLNTMSYDKYYEVNDKHFILEGLDGEIDFGQGARRIYTLNENTQVLCADEKYINLAVNKYGKGHSVYFSGLNYCPLNCFVLQKAIYYAANEIEAYKNFLVDNMNVELAYLEKSKKAIVINNSFENVTTNLFIDNKLYDTINLKPEEMKVIDIN